MTDSAGEYGTGEVSVTCCRACNVGDQSASEARRHALTHSAVGDLSLLDIAPFSRDWPFFSLSISLALSWLLTARHAGTKRRAADKRAFNSAIKACRLDRWAARLHGTPGQYSEPAVRHGPAALLATHCSHTR